MEKLTHFTIDELVCDHVLKKWGDVAWNWIDPRLFEFLEWFREAIGKPVYVNNRDKGHTRFTQRGLRCNMCKLVKEKKETYNSAHIRFQGVDFNVAGMRDDDVRLWLIKHKDELPMPIRVEAGTQGWVHVDVCNGTDDKIQFFK